MHRSWAQDGPGQNRCMCIVLFPLVLASWEALVAIAGFASKSWSERTPGEIQGAAVFVTFLPPLRSLRRASARTTTRSLPTWPCC